MPPPAGQVSPALAFLLDAGFPSPVLRAAEERAATWGVEPVEALLASGACDEDTYYRALAAETGLPFLDRVDLPSGIDHASLVASGLAPLAGPEHGPRFVAAPRAAQIGRLLAGRLPRGSALGLTTPSRLREAAMRSRAGPVAHEAANGLAEAQPTLSYRGGMDRLVRRGLAAGAAALLACAFAAPVPVLALIGSLLGALYLAMATIRIAAALEQAWSPGPPGASDALLPLYTVVVPLYREAAVVPRLVCALKALDYPPAKLDIKLVVEEGDGETLAALRACAPERMEILVAPPGEPQTKPRALNVALPLARGEYLVIYDAEDEPEPGQVRAAAARFARAPGSVVCLQARLAIENGGDGWLARLFTIEYAALFDAVNPGLCALDFPVLLGGTSNHFRTRILRDLHGWDAWNVTEDADLGLRLARAGYAVRDLPSTTWEEAPARLRPWLAQRTRWMKGYLQVWITHSREPRRVLAELGPLRAAAAVAGTLGTVIAALAYPFGLATFAWLLWDIGAFLTRAAAAPLPAAIALTVLVLTPVSMTLPAVVGLARRGAWRLLPWLVAMPVYCLLISLAAWRGLIELAVDPARWNKTDHGLARTVRRHVLRGGAAGPRRLPAAGA